MELSSYPNNMKRAFLIIQYLYLFIAIVCVVETVANWKESREQSYIFMVFAVFFIFMYYFKKVQRNKMDKNS